MAFGLFQNTAPVIGIEFGVHSLKAIQIDPAGKGTILAAGCVETPEKLLTDDAGRLTFQAQNLPDLIKQGGFKGKRAICCLPPRQTLVQHLQVQKCEPREMHNAVMTQIQIQMGFDPASAVVRHYPVGDISRNGVTKTEVVVFAIARDVVFKIIQAMRGCKLEPVGIHSAQIALLHAFDAITRRTEDRKLTSLYLDLGAGCTKAVVAHGREIAFAKTIDVAGRTFDEIIAKQLNCGLVEARRKRLSLAQMAPPPATAAPREVAANEGQVVGKRLMKREGAAVQDMGALGVALDRRLGDTAPGVTPDLSNNSPVNLSADGVDLTEPLEWLTDEVSMCLRYHQALFPERRINRAIFVGGEARHVGMCQQIAKVLKTPSQIADPLAHLDRARLKPINLDLNTPQPGWAVPFGLCHCPTDA